MQYPTCILNATDHDKLYTETRLISIHDMEYYLWVSISSNIAKYYKLYEVEEVGTNTKAICIKDVVTHESNRPWYRFDSMFLNRDPGQHVYCMKMVNTQNNNTYNQYFSYILQKEDTDKPYVYV